MVKGQIVLLDTNVIIEAFRTRCWRAIVNTFKIETVEKCCEEAATGDKRQPGYVEVDVDCLRKSVVVHAVDLRELAEIETRLAEPDRIDAGEKHLLAHALGKAGTWFVSASDKAAVYAGSELGLLERFVSVEALVRAAGVSPQLRRQFTEKWLSELRTTILLGGSL
jgi:hypothetical protein